ncbi:hypothetical protein MJT46_015365 [Ovis ammon polii x Ovis aries]|nr:hypothetical protein MJT46_015365 [Ovis ammon polii x Ovis aries]
MSHEAWPVTAMSWGEVGGLGDAARGRGQSQGDSDWAPAGKFRRSVLWMAPVPLERLPGSLLSLRPESRNLKMLLAQKSIEHPWKSSPQRKGKRNVTLLSLQTRLNLRSQVDIFPGTTPKQFQKLRSISDYLDPLKECIRTPPAV